MGTRFLRRLAVTFAVVLLAVSWAAAPPAGAAPRLRAVHGSWDNADPLASTLTQHGPVAVLDFAGGSRWSGDLAGPTSFTGRGILPARSVVLVGTITETFAGSLDGVGAGTLSFVETFHQDVTTGRITIDALVVGGSGAFSAAGGRLRFIGVTDADGVGGGTYEGVLRTDR